jgi:hypothetical protein
LQRGSADKARLSELTIQHESIQKEAAFLRDKVEELALSTAELEERSRTESDGKRRLEEERDRLEQALRAEKEERERDARQWRKEQREVEAGWQQELEAKEKVRCYFDVRVSRPDLCTFFYFKNLSQAEGDLAKARERLEVRETDLEKVQAALRSLESESRRLDESHAQSVELEFGRLKRDLARCEEDLERTRAEMEKNERLLSERELANATLVSLSARVFGYISHCRDIFF